MANDVGDRQLMVGHIIHEQVILTGSQETL